MLLLFHKLCCGLYRLFRAFSGLSKIVSRVRVLNIIITSVKKLIYSCLLFIIALTVSFYVYTENKSVDLFMNNGVCVDTEPKLYIASDELSLKDLESKLNSISNGRLSSGKWIYGNEWNELINLYSDGDKIYELETSNYAWQGLYGSWGYGVVRGNCVIYYIDIVVS